MNSEAVSGRLVLAGTPLGNARDASAHLRASLASADVVAAEDTRKLRALASALGVSVSGKVVSFYDAVEVARLPGLLEAVREGGTVLLVTDAGMPSVSDPGYRLVTACVAEDLPVTCAPGPSAVTTALALSGLPSEKFCFEGFAPRKPGERASWLAELADERRSCVFFESPHRLAATLSAAVEILGGDRGAAVCRELTKPYEEVRRGDLAQLARWASTGVRGEVTVVLAGARHARGGMAEADVSAAVTMAEQRIAEGLRMKDAVTEVAGVTGVAKRELYEAVLTARR